MKIADVGKAISEAERFLKKAKLCREDVYYTANGSPKKSSKVIEGAIYAATKRASMDLTRALAKLRRV